MATGLSFSEYEMVVDEHLGFPKAYAKICESPHLFYPHNQGPPTTFLPYKLQADEALKVREMNHTFPIIDADRNPSPDTKNFANLLWEQLNHLGNAGFDPAYFRIDPYGNVLYLFADSGSPLAWEIDHWFPCSRGGKTVPSNLRIVQWQVYRKKHNKLEFLVPWWDQQLGISVNQFLSIFASKNSDFRNRAFFWLFSDTETEEYDVMQVVESHVFPQHFIEKQRKVGLAPAAIVMSSGELDASALKPVDLNENIRPNSLAISKKYAVGDDQVLCKTVERPPSMMKENNNADKDCNKYAIIAAARDSLKHREANKLAEMQELEGELNQLKNENESQRVDLQELESVLAKHRRKVEKCRRLAESQSSYKDLLEKMIRDAMHQTVVYKEQIRLNQAANSALMARLEAQRAICDSSEQELHRRYKQRDELETQIRCHWEQARKRSRMDDTLFEERYNESSQPIPERKTPKGRELRKLLEEQKAFEVAASLAEQNEAEEAKHRERHLKVPNKEPGDSAMKFSMRAEDWRKVGGKKKVRSVPQSPQKEDEDEQFRMFSERNKVRSVPQSPQSESEEYRKRIGKENLDKWLQMLYGEDIPLPGSPSHNAVHSATETSANVKKQSLRKSRCEDSNLQTGSQPERESEKEKKMFGRTISNEIGSYKDKQIGNSKKLEAKEWERGLVPKTFRPIPPASPSMIRGMRSEANCRRKNPVVISENYK